MEATGFSADVVGGFGPDEGVGVIVVLLEVSVYGGLQVGDGAEHAAPQSDAGVQVDLATGAVSGGHAEGDTISNVEAVIGSSHSDTITGDSGDNSLEGGEGADTLEGGAGADTLDGGFGDDVLRGGSGNDLLKGGRDGDIYLFGRGDGNDTIDNRGESASNDVLRLGADIDADQLWFRMSGDDLIIDIIGTDDSVTLDDWYDGTGNRLDVELSDGSLILAPNIDVLVNAMASFAPPGDGATEYTAGQHQTLDPLIAVHWQTPST